MNKLTKRLFGLAFTICLLFSIGGCKTETSSAQSENKVLLTDKKLSGGWTSTVDLDAAFSAAQEYGVADEDVLMWQSAFERLNADLDVTLDFADGKMTMWADRDTLTTAFDGFVKGLYEYLLNGGYYEMAKTHDGLSTAQAEGYLKDMDITVEMMAEMFVQSVDISDFIDDADYDEDGRYIFFELNYSLGEEELKTDDGVEIRYSYDGTELKFTYVNAYVLNCFDDITLKKK